MNWPDGAAVLRYASQWGGSDSGLCELRLRAAPRRADHPADGGKSEAQACFIDETTASDFCLDATDDDLRPA